jgi:lycopene cyclase domain-containing protein
MLTYRFFHVLFTLPITAILALLYRPFWNAADKWRILFFCTTAFVWTVPWDNWILSWETWWYCKGCVWFYAGYVPIEEYFFVRSVTSDGTLESL